MIFQVLEVSSKCVISRTVYQFWNVFIVTTVVEKCDFFSGAEMHSTANRPVDPANQTVTAFKIK